MLFSLFCRIDDLDHSKFYVRDAILFVEWFEKFEHCKIV